MAPPVAADCVPPVAPRIEIRFATAADCSLLLRLICALATFERAPDAVVATEADLLRYGFGPDRHFEAILAFLGGQPAGFAAFLSASFYGSTSSGDAQGYELYVIASAVVGGAKVATNSTCSSISSTRSII